MSRLRNKAINWGTLIVCAALLLKVAVRVFPSQSPASIPTPFPTSTPKRLVQTSATHKPPRPWPPPGPYEWADEPWRAWLPVGPGTPAPPTEIISAPLPPISASAKIIPTPTPTLSRCPQGCDFRPPGCYLKGEIRRAGEEIYYVLLDLTNWSPAEIAERGLGVLDPPNERWFCTEEEAIASGWRSPFP